MSILMSAKHGVAIAANHFLKQIVNRPVSPTYNQDTHSTYSQPPPQPQHKYNLFSESSNMRRLALKSSSAKKQLSESRKSILAVERQMTNGQIQEFQKLNRIFKTNLSSSKWQRGQEADPEDVEYEMEEQDIIDATSRHSKSISDHTNITPGRKQQQSSYNNNPSMSQLPNVSAIYQDSLMMEESKVGRQRPSISAGRQSKTPKSSGKKQMSSKSSPYQQVHQFDITQNLVISKEAMNTIKRKMGDLARELAQNDEIGLDEATLVKFFESKTDKLLQTAAANKFTFDQISGRSKHSCWSRLSGADNNLSINESSRVLLSGGRMPPSRQAANYPHQSETFMNQKQQHNTSLSPSRVGLKPSARFRKGSESQRSRKSSKRENKGTTIRSRSSSKNMTQFSKEFKDTFAQRELINNLSQFSQSHDNRREVQEHKGSKKRHSRKASSNQNSRILKTYGCSSNRNKSGKSAVSRKSSNSALSHNYQRKSIDSRLASNSVISENRKSNNKSTKFVFQQFFLQILSHQFFPKFLQQQESKEFFHIKGKKTKNEQINQLAKTISPAATLEHPNKLTDEQQQTGLPSIDTQQTDLALRIFQHQQTMMIYEGICQSTIEFISIV